MADILRVTTPLITKNPTPMQRQPVQAELFSLMELEKVVKSAPQSEILSQNNTLIKDGEASTLINMLQDPSYSYGFIKGLFFLQEVVGLLPLNNSTATPEIRQMFEELFIGVEELPTELLRQESSATVFNNELFTFIRESFSAESPTETILSALELVKTLNSMLDRPGVLNSVANNLQHLAESYSSSERLSTKLQELSDTARRIENPDQFAEFKRETLQTIKQAETSILFTSKLSKLTSLLRYNLSRYNDIPESLDEVAAKFAMQLPDDESRGDFILLLRDVLDLLESKSPRADFFTAAAEKKELTQSNIIETLTKLIGRQVEKGGLSPAAESKLEKIIHTMLSTPSNFTPLLHYIIPIQFEDIKSFAEFWVDPGPDASSPTASTSKTHIFFVVNVDGVGQFEAELLLDGRRVDINLYCPPDHIKHFSGLSSLMRGNIPGSPYSFGSVNIGKLEQHRSLLEVFSTLKYRRLGLDITV